MGIAALEGAPQPPAGLVERIWERDASAWPPGDDDPAGRLGWLDLPEFMAERIEPIAQFARSVRSDGVEAVALLGMGGSSLAAEVFAALLSAPGFPELVVCDSTHPDQVRAWRDRLPLGRTLFVVASKSGGTVETLALYRYFRGLGVDPGRFVAITDPGTSLADLARGDGFGAAFTARPDLGGRFSALSEFGLVPAALAGADVGAVLGRAADAARRCRDPGPGNPGLRLGTALAALVRGGRDKLTFVTDAASAPFADWAEQLLAESTGKDGTGIVPVVREPAADPGAYGADRAFAVVRAGPGAAQAPHAPVVEAVVADPVEVGADMFEWEFATAVAGSLLGVNAFDQPDVEAAKRAARAALDSGGGARWPDDDPGKLFADCAPGDLGCVLVFAPYSAEARRTLDAARARLVEGHGIATSAGFGPRYLHSIGQLHKGGPDRIRALVVLDPPEHDEPIPGSAHGFAGLVASQAAGDARALAGARRRVACTTLETLAHWAGA